jgi:hypothetical protein
MLIVKITEMARAIVDHSVYQLLLGRYEVWGAQIFPKIPTVVSKF